MSLFLHGEKLVQISDPRSMVGVRLFDVLFGFAALLVEKFPEILC
jgi:hypothetical protein